jgi:hypothetical protein
MSKNQYWHEDTIDMDYIRKNPFCCRICTPHPTYPQYEKRFTKFFQWYDHMKAEHPLNVLPDYEF